MIVLANRADGEAALGHALSRHIGHTTAAYDLDRILSVLEFFQGRPSAYKEELVHFLMTRAGDSSDVVSSGKDYLDGTIAFARALGVIHQTSSREARLQNYGATEQGRSLFAAKKVGSPDFYAFYRARVAFLADSDSLAAMLTYYERMPAEPLAGFYVSFFKTIRERRYNWLRSILHEPILFERVAHRLSWLHLPNQRSDETRIEPFTLNTARHHTTPRKGWLVSFGMLDRETDQLTEFGERALSSLRQDGDYFWLGPARGVQETLRVSTSVEWPEPFEDAFNFTRESVDANPRETASLSKPVADIMREGFPYAKLVHATQASLQLPIEFIIYRSFKDGVRYDPMEVLKNVFQEQREQIDRLSARKGQIGFYRVR